MSVRPDPPAPGPPRRPVAPSRREVLEGLAGELVAAGIEEGRHEAERLMTHVLGVSRAELLLHSDQAVEPEDAGLLASLSQRRMAGMPLQHIEGTVAFRDLTLVCDPRALVPRPETEQLVQRVLEWATTEERRAGVRRVARPGGTPPRLDVVLDIGTGSGAIALSLLHEGISARAVAVDVSEKALEQAVENAVRVGLERRIEFRLAARSPWEAVRTGESFDAIVANPPYIADTEIEELPVEVRVHDPREALSGGPDGLEVIREIVHGARARLRARGALFLEVGHGQAPQARRMLEDAGGWSEVRVESDLAGRQRFVIAVA